MQNPLFISLKSAACLLLAVVTLSLTASAQSEPVKSPEVMPVLNSCAMIEDRTERETCTNNGILEHVMKKLIYPEDAKAAGIEGTVFVQFIVNDRGEVAEAKMIQGPAELSKAAIRVVNELPGFVPGTQKGKPVSVEYVLPIRFALAGE